MNAGGISAEGAGSPLSAGPEAEIPSVDWWMTSHCNLTCDFCYGPAPAKDPVERRPEILRALAASSARVVTFCGGEPLLIRRIDEYAASVVIQVERNVQTLVRYFAPLFVLARLAQFPCLGVVVVAG